MLNRTKNVYASLDVFVMLRRASLGYSSWSDKWFIGSDNLSLLPMAKIVHVNLCVVCAFSDCDVLHFTMFLKKFLSLKSFEALLQIWLVPSRFAFPPFLCSSILLFLYSSFPLFFRSFVLHFLFLFPFSSVLLFLCCNFPIFLCSFVHLFLCSVLRFLCSYVPRLYCSFVCLFFCAPFISVSLCSFISSSACHLVYHCRFFPLPAFSFLVP